jgi:RimJ/RimL family protein N-acetyltransferase
VNAPLLAPAATTLVTARLRLRLLDGRQTDAALYRALYTCPRVMAQIAPPLDDVEADAAFARVCRHNALERPGHRSWAVEDRITETGLGIVALHRSGARAELGLMLLPRAWNGHTSRTALSAVIDHGFGTLGLEHIDADCREGPNTRILRHLLLPLGFEPVPAMRAGYAQWALPIGRWRRR